MSKESKIPDFETLKEARDFWDTHSLADFADELEEAKEVQFTAKRVRRGAGRPASQASDSGKD